MIRIAIHGNKSIVISRYDDGNKGLSELLFLTLWAVVLCCILISCEKEPDLAERELLLTSYVWDNTESCGTISGEEGLYTCVFGQNGIYRTYYKAFETFNCRWYLVDYNTLSLDNINSEITELDKSRLILKGPGSFWGFDIKCYYKYQSLPDPYIATVGVSDLTKTSATIHGYLRTCSDAEIFAEYGLSSAFGSLTGMSGNPVAGVAVREVEVNLSGLMPGTTYSYRLKAVDGKGIAYYGAGHRFSTYNTVSLIDIDDNEYNTVTIGTQTWMAEPLMTTRYNDGTMIPYVTDSIEWAALESPAFCWYRNEPGKYKNTYGALYNWYTVNTGKLCPAGWHVPTGQDVAELIDFLGTGAGDKLTQGHYDIEKLIPYLEASNETGFSAVPVVLRGDYGFSETDCKYWCSSEYDGQYGWYLNANNQFAGTSYESKDTGLPVRCIKD